MEFWVIDERGRLCDAAGLVDAHERVEPEFVGPLVEVKTTPHETVASLRRELQRTLRTVLAAAAEDGQRLVPLGTPLTAVTGPAAGQRGELFERIYGDGVRSAKNCAGMHVHVEKTQVDRQLNLLTALDPALALVSSSPYYCGEREHRSSRAAAYRRACGDDFERFCGLWPYTDDVSEWEDRVRTAYETFQELGAERGVDPDRVADEFAPADTVLNPVRLRSEQPTVEWRAPDTALPSHALQLAADVHRLIDQVTEKPLLETESLARCGVDRDAVRIPEFSLLSSLSDAAIDRGLDSDRVRAYLRQMGFDTTSYSPIASDIDGPKRIDDRRARAVRSRYADHLRADVRRMTAGRDPTPGRSVRHVSESP